MAVKPFSSTLPVETVTIGATVEDGGTRSHTVKIGGQTTMPFLPNRGKIPHEPVTAYEIWDVPPVGWPGVLLDSLGDHVKDPVSWAEYLIKEAGAKILCLRLMGAHPDWGGRSTQEMKEVVTGFLESIPVPLIITGCGIEDIDREILPIAARATRGEKILLGNATDQFHRELVDACIKYGHSLITESPIDINIAKQVNILACEAGLPKDRIVMYATTGALGYGLEYAYSIMEKTRLLGLEGDSYMNKPQLAFVGQETWKARESSPGVRAGIQWEAFTGYAYLHAGADIVILRHQETGRVLKEVTSK